MAKDSAIAWCDATFNPVWGCTQVSPGCAHCYADTLASRWKYDVFGYAGGERKALRTFGEAHWREPLLWNAQAAVSGRKRVFCASMADVFDPHPDWPPQRERLWELIRQTPHLDWLLLTKRPENMPGMLPSDWDAGYANVWLGTSVEDERVKSRILALRAVPARVRFLSCEPLIGPLRLSEAELAGIGWVIIGGESGQKARPMRGAWVDDLLSDVRGAGVTPFFKQTGTALARELGLAHPKGERLVEWPAKWQVQEFPQ